ncbi:MAG: hypothetical protein ACI8Y7_001179 [Candidatus Woesearchaeota archaeon]|jgi:hypothetical protein
MFSHALVDFLTHQQSAYNHFLPIPLSLVRSVISYTSMWFTIVERVLLVVFVIWLWKKKRTLPKKKKKTSSKRKVLTR